MDEVRQLGGFTVGLAFMTVTTFVIVSYTELQNKIGQQAARGEEVYRLQAGDGGRGAQQQQRKGGGGRSGGAKARRRK